MRVAVVDVGSNSTRLLIADVAEQTISDRLRRSTVTRLAEGVDAGGALAPAAVQRVHRALADYRADIERHDADLAIGVLTSAVRDAADGEVFAEEVRERFGIDARILSGEEEARLTYLGATSEMPADDVPTAVVDVGGGSTEIAVGAGARLALHASAQVGVVRHSERHLHNDPPGAAEVRALRRDAARALAAALPAGVEARRGIATAGTATQAVSILGSQRLAGAELEELLRRLSALPLARRREVSGLDPARAGVIVAGLAILLEAMRALGLREVLGCEHDIMRGAALCHAAFRAGGPQSSG